MESPSLFIFRWIFPLRLHAAQPYWFTADFRWPWQYGHYGAFSWWVAALKYEFHQTNTRTRHQWVKGQIVLGMCPKYTSMVILQCFETYISEYFNSAGCSSVGQQSASFNYGKASRHWPKFAWFIKWTMCDVWLDELSNVHNHHFRINALCWSSCCNDFIKWLFYHLSSCDVIITASSW